MTGTRIAFISPDPQPEYRHVDVDGDRLLITTADIPGHGAGLYFRTDRSGSCLPVAELPALLAELGRIAAAAVETVGILAEAADVDILADVDGDRLLNPAPAPVPDPMCACGHTGSKTHDILTRPPGERFGRCIRQGCGCHVFTAVEDVDAAVAAEVVVDVALRTLPAAAEDAG